MPRRRRPLQRLQSTLTLVGRSEDVRYQPGRTDKTTIQRNQGRNLGNHVFHAIKRSKEKRPGTSDRETKRETKPKRARTARSQQRLGGLFMDVEPAGRTFARRRPGSLRTLGTVDRLLIIHCTLIGPPGPRLSPNFARISKMAKCEPLSVRVVGSAYHVPGWFDPDEWHGCCAIAVRHADARTGRGG